MIIKSLQTMEKIVAKNNSLSWVGWDVVDRKKSEAGRTSVDGVRVKDQWYLQRTYPITRNGWDIPNKYKG